MKAISLWQPFASLLVEGVKRVETRGWRMNYRGELLIHAAKTWNRDLAEMAYAEPFKSALRSLGVMWSDKLRPTLPFGAIVGRVDVFACVPTEQATVRDDDVNENVYSPSGGTLKVSTIEKEFGDYSLGRWAILCRNAVRFESPILYRGEQGIFEVPEDCLTEHVRQ